MYMLNVDLEATCDDGGRIARHDMEMIEIGAVLLDPQGGVVGEFQSFIRPYKNPVLTPFCRELTGITQADVDSGPSVHEVMSELALWLKEYQPLQWYSWGDYDDKQLALDCRRNNISWPIPGSQVNAKQLFRERTAST